MEIDELIRERDIVAARLRQMSDCRKRQKLERRLEELKADILKCLDLSLSV
jgi:hypothetical protein